MAPIPRLRHYDGPAILSYGFRPFFLLGALQAGLAMPIWLALWFGELELPTAFSPRDWHVHEMLYGYLPAVVTGFLLTAVPNWTGRMPLQGGPLLGLVVLWVAGRVAISISALVGWWMAAVVDVAFLAVVATAVARETMKSRNWRNQPILALLTLFAIGNAAFHFEAKRLGVAETGTRIGIAVAVMLIMVIGGRIIPSFTNNWLGRQGVEARPVPFGRFDVLSLALAAAALTGWCARPDAAASGAALILAGIVQGFRLSRWAGYRTVSDRLVLILHLAYAFVPIGFGLLGASVIGLVPVSAGLHAWTGGAIGTMTLAVMTRATLGHTGRTPQANSSTHFIYGFVLLATALRVWAALEPSRGVALVWGAGAAWSGAFIGFCFAYGPALFRPRLRA